MDLDGKVLVTVSPKPRPSLPNSRFEPGKFSSGLAMEACCSRTPRLIVFSPHGRFLQLRADDLGLESADREHLGHPPPSSYYEPTSIMPSEHNSSARPTSTNFRSTRQRYSLRHSSLCIHNLTLASDHRMIWRKKAHMCSRFSLFSNSRYVDCICTRVN